MTGRRQAARRAQVRRAQAWLFVKAFSVTFLVAAALLCIGTLS